MYHQDVSGRWQPTLLLSKGRSLSFKNADLKGIGSVSESWSPSAAASGLKIVLAQHGARNCDGAGHGSTPSVSGAVSAGAAAGSSAIGAGTSALQVDVTVPFDARRRLDQLQLPALFNSPSATPGLPVQHDVRLETRKGTLSDAMSVTASQTASEFQQQLAAPGPLGRATHTDPEAAWVSLHTRLAAVQSQQAALANAMAAQEAALARILALLSPSSDE